MSVGTFRALLIGNSTFPKDPHELPDLKGPANDLRLLQDAFTHPELGLYRPEHVATLLDRTRAEIMEQLEAFFTQAGKDDQLFLYYSGHGRLDTFSNLYLCASDTRTSYLVSTGISDEQVNAILRHSPSSRIVIVLDCCHSGRFKGMDLPRHLTGEGRFVLTSSRSRELSQDAAQGDGPSAFTRHLADALLSGEIDADQDGFISLNEVYNYILPRLHEETKQTPQRSFDKTVAELALGRSYARRSKPTALKPGERPRLAVSEESIEIKHVQLGETLPPEVVDVFNQGGGVLDWTATCDADWVQLEPAKGYFSIRLSPKPGINRARIHVRDKGPGGSKTVRVLVEVEEEAQEPKLVVSETDVDFGDLPAGGKVPPRVVRLSNAGGGALNAELGRVPDWLEAKLYGEVVELVPRPGLAGTQDGRLVINSDGGQALVRVRAAASRGPVLRVEPAAVDFHTVTSGEKPSVDVAVTNGGDGHLEWQYKKSGLFFNVRRSGKGLALTLSAEPGAHQGAVVITSNGGDATIDVRAKVVTGRSPAPARPAPPPPAPTAPGIGPGRWQIEINAFGVVNSQMVLDFYPNGQLAGQQALMGFQAQITGAWGYDPNTRILSLQLMTQMMGIQAPDFRQVLLTGQQGDLLIGQDNNMLQYGFRKIG